MNQFSQTQTVERVSETNKVLRNTYFLLGLTLAFSSIVTAVSVAMMAPALPWWGMLIGAYGLMFLTEKNRNSSLGLVFVFLFTGFMGYTLGPLIGMFLAAGAGETVMTALGGTALAFFATSAYALTTKRDLSFLNGMIVTGFVVLIVAMIANFFLAMPALSLAISSMFILFSSAVIMLTTQNIIRGGETNYISATVTLYVSIYNIFVSLLSILGIGGDD
ncbi:MULTISPECIES: Bax inhibitor-1/YccA family protein [unclassified Motilimonas]|uniref:Bax inhibitor-1/YccA family protein n=1 Tax=Motilimonas TaxID=1914248 RepID=UPI001E659482|nr:MULTISPECIES: Bax inhibitor-1/YccA family protein [unclassified Motilimonas]MCE0556431.1 Bax inhibitor-1/YccA family protein [Motilimonas sp. E26]MDO6525799.1 Bax inhibitor-1/YccA family protein [Motilimonas sp. 1_MG-2023]